jgi:hypothetical protein
MIFAQFDINGIAGGCQAIYTVIQNTTVTNPTCQNVTFPTALDVVGTVDNGPMSQYGFVDQVCLFSSHYIRP